ncbi:MAG TPA: cache domain-containing protein, partial [Pyrinomonadaceae bacterium]|nr:cache domain-containing protein [Pyrinomonadaceae bacterium]
MQVFRAIKRSAPLPNTLGVLTTTIVLLVVPFLVYYLVYVQKQNAYFTERGLRSLSLIGEQVASKVESAGSILKNGSEKFINSKPSTDQSPGFDPQKPDADNFKNLTKAFGSLKDGPQITPISMYKASEGKTIGSTTIDGVSEDDGSLWLYLNYESLYVNDKPDADKQVIVVVVKAKTDFSKLLQPLLTRRDSIGDASGAEFQDLLIAEGATGRVFFQMDRSELSVASLDKLPANNEQKRFEIKDLEQSSSVTDVRLAESSIKLFSEPLGISLRTTGSADGRNTTWIICGLIPSESFRAEAWSVSYAWLILCAFITSLMVLNWPFIKLVLIGAKDRLRTADVYFLTFSTVVVLAVVTSFGLYAYSYESIGGQLDSQLTRLSIQIKANLRDELGRALSQLQSLANNCNLIQKLDTNARCGADSTTINTAAFYQHAELDKNNILPQLLAEGKPAYPYFDGVAWLDKTGWQKAKWTIRESTTHYLNLSTRAYFRNLRLGDFQELELPSQTGQGVQPNPIQFALVPIISKTTGRNEVELSTFATDPNWITAFETRLISLMQPVLPAGFGYLVIDKNGKVIFHSDEAHHLGENFFKECDDDPALRSAVVSKNSDAFKAKYLGQDYSLLVTSVEGFPDWSLVVFRNKQTLRSAFLELLSSQSLLFFVYSIVLMAALSVFFLINRHNERRAWIWPSQKKATVYYQSLVLMLLMSLFSVFLILLVHGESLVILPTLTSFIAIFVFFIHLSRGLRMWLLRLCHKLSKNSKRFREQKYVWHRRFKLAYVLNLGMLLVVVAILPAAAYFRFAFDSEMELFIKHGQFTLESGLAERSRRIRSQYAEIEGASDKENNATLIEKRIGEEWDVYDKFFFATQHEPKEQGISKSLACPPQNRLLSLTSYLPLSNRTSIERRGLLQNSSSNGTCKWEKSPSGNLVLHLDGTAARDLPWVDLSTPVPSLGVPGPVWWILLLLTFASFFSWLHFMVRKVFLLDVHRPTSYALDGILRNRFDRNLFIVLEAPYSELLTIARNGVHLIDVQENATSRDWAKKIKYSTLKDCAAIVVHHFDYKLHDTPTNLQKLHLLEELLKLKRPVIVFSDVEPSLYKFTNGDLNEQENGHDDASRWAAIISQFFTEYAEDGGDCESYRNQLEREKDKLLPKDLKGHSNEEIERIKKLVEMLDAECAHKLPLQNIGLQLLREESFATLSPEHLLNRIVNQARTYYSDIWNTCSPDEQLTLFHLAQDRLLSHRDPDIEPLLRRGLIIRKTDVHLMNESFRQFVKSTEQVEDVSKNEENAKRDSTWNTLKVPLLIALIAITIFLFVTQRDLYTSALAGLTALTTMIPALFKVLSLFQNEPAPRPP